MCEIVNIWKLIVRVWDNKEKNQKGSRFVVSTAGVVHALSHKKGTAISPKNLWLYLAVYQPSVEVAPQ